MLDSTSRITALCRERGIVVGLMTDGRFSGGSVGLVIGHVGPEAAVGGPIDLIEEDDILVDLNDNTLSCKQLEDATTKAARKSAWDAAVAANGGAPVGRRCRHAAAEPHALFGGVGRSGAGMHPGGRLWVNEPRKADKTGFAKQQASLGDRARRRSSRVGEFHPDGRVVRGLFLARGPIAPAPLIRSAASTTAADGRSARRCPFARRLLIVQ